MKNKFTIIDAFNHFINDVFKTTDNYYFFFELQKNNINSITDSYVREYHHSALILHNINTETGKTTDVNGYRTRDINSENIDQISADFNNTLTTLILLKIYNSLEIFLLQAIWIKYYHEEYENPITSRDASKKIINKIKDECNCRETTNNKFLIEYIKLKNSCFEKFLKLKAGNAFTKDKETMEDFFIFFSTIRNAVAHNNSRINNDTINSFQGGFFNYFFNKSNSTSDITYYNTTNNEEKVIDIKNNLIQFNFKDNLILKDFEIVTFDFITNTVKIIFEEDNLDFLNTEEFQYFQ